MAGWQENLQKKLAGLLEAIGDAPIHVALDIPSSPAQVPMRIFLRKTDKLTADALPGSWEPYRRALDQEDYLVFAPFGDIRSSQKVTPPAELTTERATALKAAASAAADAPIQIYVLPPEHVWRTFRELMPELPPQLGGGPSSVLTEGVRWVGIGIDPAKPSLAATIESNSPSAAASFAEFLPGFLRSTLALQLGDDGAEIQQLLTAALSKLEIRVEQDRVLLSTPLLSDQQQSKELMRALVDSIVAPISRDGKMKKFKQLGLAIWNYESANKCLPPNQKGRNVDGSSRLSWRVHILPYLGEVDLYKKFALEEAWNSETNIKLLEAMPDVFKSYPDELLIPNSFRPGYTTFLAPKGPKTIFGSQEPVTVGKVTDGTSNTLWMVEVKPELAVPWTAPQDYEFKDDDPLAGLEIDQKGIFIGGMADGSVHALPADISPTTLLHMFQMNDGNLVDW
jgi:hypothetical protein